MKRTLLTLTVAAIAAAIALAPAPAMAQASITGAIRGYVADDSGNFLPGASVTLSGASLPDEGRFTITDMEGAFVFDGLPVGNYSLNVNMIGYQPYEMVQIVVNPDEARTFNVILAEGLTERIVVVAERSVIDTTNTSTHEVLDATYVNKLPLVSRRYQQILTLFPGVSNDEGFTLAQYHINGSRVTQNAFRLDGANINDFVTGTFGLNVNQNAIERFELNTSGYQAEYGEQSGGIANIITKSGTNTFEFMYSGFYRSDNWSSDTPGASDLHDSVDSDGISSNNHLTRPETQQWQELAAGGPIIKNKLWFFSSFQYWQEDIGSLFNDSIRKGDRYHGQFKLTWQTTPTNTMVFNLASDPSKFTSLITDARYAEGTNFDQDQGAIFFQVRDTQILGPNTFLESQLFVHNANLEARPSESGLGSFTITVDPNAPTSFTGTYPNKQDRTTNRYRASTALTTQMGSHRIKGGIDYSWMDFEGTNRTEDVTVNLDAVAVGYYGPGAQLSYVYDYRNPEVTDRSDTEMAAYVQDTFIVNEHWTLEGGLRADNQSIIGKTNVAPRAGVAWDPKGDSKSKAYANWGRFYDNVFTSFVDFQDTDGAVTTMTFVVPGYAYYYNVPIAVYDYVVDGDLEAPYKDSWTIGYEHQLPWDLRLGVSMTQWKGHNQMRTTFADNPAAVPSSVNLDPNATAAVIFDTKGRSEYSDWKLMARKSFSRRFEVLGSYTRSRVMGDSGNDFGFEDRGDPRALDYSRLSYDRPDLINLSAFGLLPWGIEVTGIYRYQSGRLYSPVDPTNSFNIDTSVGGKNSQRMPPVRSVDLSVSKRFDMRGTQMRLTAQIFNLTNELNVVDVERFTTPSSSFGQPVRTDFGRMMQFGLEVRF